MKTGRRSTVIAALTRLAIAALMSRAIAGGSIPDPPITLPDDRSWPHGTIGVADCLRRLG